MNSNTNAASVDTLKPGLNKVSFASEGVTLVGNLYLPTNYRPRRQDAGHRRDRFLDHCEGADGRSVRAQDG